jgi:hypothetical protein
VEQGRFSTLTARLPQLAYVALAPFTGAEEAITLVEEMKGRESPSVIKATRRRRAAKEARR